MTQLVQAKEITASEDALRIVFVGHVDHGKSTLVGRLLKDTDSVAPSRIKQVEEICRERGRKFEYAFLLDALEEEQDQGITIDVTEVLFKTPKRLFRVIDAPGHKEFLKNMVSGASNADLAILLIDAEEGLREQSKRHTTILSILGITQIVVGINKMDLVSYKEEVFESLRNDYSRHLELLKIKPIAFVPLSAYEGDNLIQKSPRMPWYEGSPLLEILENIQPPRSAIERPLRLPIQDVYKFDQKRILAGRVESGTLSTNDEILFLPSEKSGIVKSIEKWNPPQGVGGPARRRFGGGPAPPALRKAHAGESIGIVLQDSIFVERGEVACHAQNRSLVAQAFQANVFWLGHEHLQRGERCLLKLTTQEVECVIESVKKVINSSTLEEVSKMAQEVAKNEVAEIILRTKKPVAFDLFQEIEETGRFVLVVGSRVSGGGIIQSPVQHFSSI